jgi:nucleotide-binding universal stress UspA family protein
MANLKNHILVPIDFSEQSRIALGQSYNLARLTRASLTLIYVIEEHFHLPFTSKKEDKSLEKNVLKELKKLADETYTKSGVKTDTIVVPDETYTKSGVKTDTIVVHGKVYEEIQNAAKKLKSSMIIMGTNGSGKGLKRFIGSNALRVIREAPCPVITIKGKKHRTGCKRILLPLDLTKETKEKVTKAIDFANLFGSHINLLSVLTTDDEFIVNKLRRQMQQVEDFIKQHDVSCSHEFVNGDDVEVEVIKYAKNIKADLIMIMTQQESKLIDMFIDSEAQEVINGSDIPVLSIRPKVKKNVALSPLEY